MTGKKVNVEVMDTKEIKEDKLIFQILDWDFFHDEDDEGNKQFVIRLFGKDKQQRTVYVQVDDFKPYFYVELQDNWKISTIESILTEVKKKVGKDKIDGLIKYNIEEKYKFWGFTNYKRFKFVKLTFNDFDSMKAYSRAFTKPYKIFTVSKKWLNFKLYESNILPVLRFMHIRQLEAVGWVSIDKSKLEEFDSREVLPTCNELNYKTKWQNVNKVEDKVIEKFVIASFDIECTSEDGSFPQPTRDGDKVIQIGITLSRFGEKDCFAKHLLGLHKTAPIEGATVEWFNTEEELLLGFTKYIRKVNPDIITGYNIFGFDFNYLMERAKKLDITPKFDRLSRVTGESSAWVDQTLQSAALGTNLMRYYKMTGRVVIDLMKVVQRDHKLSSYKLDYVASNFLKEKVEKFEDVVNNTSSKISTKSTFGISKGDYITISYTEGAVESNYKDKNEKDKDISKFQVKELGPNYIIIDGAIDLKEFEGKKCDIFWCEAKDDITPNDIFRMFKGTPEERAEVGKYCLKDCSLCNKILEKLQIVGNNVGMANVCNVPLSYLFLRGQGVKIFSLVAKKCREKEHLIPVIQKKEKKKEWDGNSKWGKPEENDPVKLAQIKLDKIMEQFIYSLNNKNKETDDVAEDDEEDVGYEGAIVFPPKPGVYFEPITVLDYASLYPNAMILRNLSHETFVNDPHYDNMPGYRYHTISYKIISKEDIDNKVDNSKPIEMVTCRFAEKLDGSKGIIPEILNDLLTARKKYKKIMEAEKDPALKAILDGLQLAYKVTANSLYGQTGASTSPICMKEIAASTTATGREMLQFSKYFIEYIYSNLINLALDDKKKFMTEMEKVFKYYPHEISYDDINRSNNVVTKVDLHVCTDKNRELPDSKFVRKSIGYEVDTLFKNDFKDYFETFRGKYPDIYSKIFENVMEKGKMKEDITFTGTFSDAIFGLSVEKRNVFYKDIKKYIVDKKGKSETLYENYKGVWNVLGIDSEGTLKKAFLKPLQELDSDQKEVFLKNLEIAVDESGYNGKDEMFAKFYDFVNKFIGGYSTSAEVIYGDSVTADEVLLLKDSKTGETTIKRIDELSDEWNKYDGFKTNDANEYFTNIVKQLIKPDVNLLDNRVVEKKNVEYLTDWIGGKYAGGIQTKTKNGIISYVGAYKVNNKSTDKWFSTRKYGVDEAKNLAEQFVKDGVEKLGLIKNKYRYVKDKNTNTVYLEVNVGHNEVMLCDPDDIDIVEKYILHIKTETRYVYAEDFRFHKLVLEKLTDRLPKKIKSKFDDCTVDHVDRNKIDNRKNNLRMLLPKYQQRNRGPTSGNEHYKYVGVLQNHKQYHVDIYDVNSERVSKYVKTLEEGYKIIENNNAEIDKDYKNSISNVIKDINQTLQTDNKDRYQKEQSASDYLVWSGKEWTKIKRVIRHKTNKKIYRIITKTSIIDVTEDHSLIDEYGNYVRPVDCIETTRLMQSYPKNVVIDNIKDYRKTKFVSDNKEDCSQYYANTKKSGYNVTIDYDEKTKIFTLYKTKDKILEPNKIINMILLKDTKVDEYEYVYDLETESGRFHAGVGELIIKNTDSVFFKMNITDLETKEKLKNKVALGIAIQLGIWASNLIDTLLPNPMSQCYEKVLWPLALQGKKRYVGNLYEKNINKYKRKSMGTEEKRRDNAPIVKLILAGIVSQILDKHSAEGAYEFARDMLQKIITGKIEMDKFVITKTLKGNALTKAERKLDDMKPKEMRSYKNRSGITHAVLADRMADRDPGNRPLSNDRIPYMYIETKGKVNLQGERVETPEYINKNKLKVDYLFYITNQIKKPALKFLDLLLENAEAVFTEFEIKEENRKMCMMPISYYTEKDEKEREEYSMMYEDNDNDFNDSDDDSDNESHNDSDSEDERPKKKIKKINPSKKMNTNVNKGTYELVNFDDLVTKKDDDEAPKKITKKKPPSKKIEEVVKPKKVIQSDITYGGLLDGLNENESDGKNKRLDSKKKPPAKKKTDSKKISPKISSKITSYELLGDFDVN